MTDAQLIEAIQGRLRLIMGSLGSKRVDPVLIETHLTAHEVTSGDALGEITIVFKSALAPKCQFGFKWRVPAANDTVDDLAEECLSELQEYVALDLRLRSKNCKPGMTVWIGPVAPDTP